MSPVDTPRRSATSAMRVAPKPRSITTWDVTSRISFRRSSTLGRATARTLLAALDERGPTNHGAAAVDDAQLGEGADVVDSPRPRPPAVERSHRADVDEPAAGLGAEQAARVGVPP